MSPLQRFENADWTLVPPHLQQPLERWVTDGIRPRPLFLQRILANDLTGAVKIGNPVERAALADIVCFLMTECPAECFGQPRCL